MGCSTFRWANENVGDSFCMCLTSWPCGRCAVVFVSLLIYVPEAMYQFTDCNMLCLGKGVNCGMEGWSIMFLVCLLYATWHPR